MSLFGGGTDFYEWYKTHPTLVIVSAMDYYCYISIKKQCNFFKYKSRVSYSKTEFVKKNSEIRHPSVRESLKYFQFENGLDIQHVGELPAQSGIGSSSSFTVGFLNAMHALKHQKISKKQLANEAIYVEQDMIKEAVGVQDQISAAYGGLNIIKLGPGKRMDIKPLKLSFSYKEYLKRSILLGFTGLSRDGIKLMEKHKSGIKTGKSTTLLEEIEGITREAQKIFEIEEDIEKLGKLLQRAWAVKRNFVKKNENESFDEILKIAMANGALGGKLMGAGAQGFFYFFAHPSKHHKIIESLPKVRVWVPFNFTESGSRILKVA